MRVLCVQPSCFSFTSWIPFQYYSILLCMQSFRDEFQVCKLLFFRWTCCFFLKRDITPRSPHRLFSHLCPPDQPLAPRCLTDGLSPRSRLCLRLWILRRPPDNRHAPPGTDLCTPQLLPDDRQGSPLAQPRVTVAPQSRLSSRQPLCPSKVLPLGKAPRLWDGPLSTNCGREVV